MNNSQFSTLNSQFSIVAYTYVEPILDKVLDASIWGWEIDKIYQDIGDRQQLHQLINDIQTQPIDYLLIFNLFELGNKLAQVIENIKIIEQLNVEIIALNQDYSTSKFKAITDEQTKAEYNQLWLDIEQIYQRRKLKISHAQNRLKVLPPPGKAPYGYVRGKESYLIDKATAPIARAFFERFLLYASVRDCVRFLATKYKKKIVVSTANYWLTNPVYQGDLRYKNQQIICDTHTPIISREEAAQIKRILKSHSRVKPRSASANYCLAGLVKCSKCQSNFKITSVTQKYKKQKYLYLTSTNCQQEKSCKSIDYEQVLNAVITSICQQFKLIETNNQIPDIELIKQGIQQQIKQKIDIIDSLNNLVKTQILDEQTAQLRNYQLQTQVSQLKTKLVGLPPNNLETIAKTLSLEQFWYDLSEQEKRFYLREFVRSININNSSIATKEFDLSLDLYFTQSY